MKFAKATILLLLFAGVLFSQFRWAFDWSFVQNFCWCLTPHTKQTMFDEQFFSKLSLWVVNGRRHALHSPNSRVMAILFLRGVLEQKSFKCRKDPQSRIKKSRFNLGSPDQEGRLKLRSFRRSSIASTKELVCHCLLLYGGRC